MSWLPGKLLFISQFGLQNPYTTRKERPKEANSHNSGYLLRLVSSSLKIYVIEKASSYFKPLEVGHQKKNMN